MKPPQSGKAVGARWVVIVALVVAFPAVATVAGITYLALRKRWPDRLLAWLLMTLAMPLAVWLLWRTDYAGRWVAVAVQWLGSERRPTPADWLAIVGVGATVGPVCGAVWWRISQRRRERAPYRGLDEREARQDTEDRRRARITALAQRASASGSGPVRRLAAPWAVPVGDERGPLLGVFQRGDLTGDWRAGRRVRLAMDNPNNRHLIVLGATGLGKTETLLLMIDWAVRHGRQVIYLSAKESTGPSDTVALRLAEIAGWYGVQLRTLSTTEPYDPMRGTADDIRDRLTRIEVFSDDYHRHAANLLVGLALQLAAANGEPISALPDLIFSLVRSRLVNLAATMTNSKIDQLVDALSKPTVEGALIRYGSLGLHLRGWLAPREAGGWAWEDTDVACVELPTSTRPEAGAALLRLLLRDLAHYIGHPVRRPYLEDGRQRKLLVIVEEAGAVAGDPVVGREMINGVERWRSAGVYSVLSAQDPLGLGDLPQISRLLTNGAVLSFRQTLQAEMISNVAGTQRQDEAGADYDKHDRRLDQGVVRRQHGFKLHPQMLREFGLGEFALISAGRWAKVAGVRLLPRIELPTLPALPAARSGLPVKNSGEVDDLARAKPGSARPQTEPE